MASRLLVAHQRAPDAVGIEIVAGVVEQRRGVCFAQARDEALANEAALAVAAVGVESIADDGPALADDVSYDGDQRQGHLGEVDVGICNRGGDWQRHLANVNDTHGASFSFESKSFTTITQKRRSKQSSCR